MLFLGFFEVLEWLKFFLTIARYNDPRNLCCMFSILFSYIIFFVNSCQSLPNNEYIRFFSLFSFFSSASCQAPKSFSVSFIFNIFLLLESLSLVIVRKFGGFNETKVFSSFFPLLPLLFLEKVLSLFLVFLFSWSVVWCKIIGCNWRWLKQGAYSHLKHILR